METIKNPIKWNKNKPPQKNDLLKGISFLKRIFILTGLLGSLSAFSQGLCLNELEMAALFSTQKDTSSRKGKIKKANKTISKLERDIEKINDKVKKKENEAEDFLENFTGTLNDGKLKNLIPGKTITNTSVTQYKKDAATAPDPLEMIEDFVSDRAKRNDIKCKPPVFTGSSITSQDHCYDWQEQVSENDSKGFFKNNGKISKSFCDRYTADGDSRECKDQLDAAMEAYEELDEFKKKMKERTDKLEKRIADLEDDIETWEDEEFTAELDGEEEETEAGGLCTKCLQDLRRVTGPSGWQRLGSGLTAALGVGLSIFGLREARRAQAGTNELLALQGMPAENNFGYSLAGLSLGYPLVSQGLYGLTRGGMSQGGFGCSPTASPYMAQMQQMQYQAMMNPFGMMGGLNPMMGMQFQMGGGNPWGMMNPFGMMGGLNPMMGMQFQMGGGNPWGMMNPLGMMGGLNPMIGMGFQMGGGNPWGMNPMAMMSPMMGMRFQAMSPWGMNPMMQGAFNPWMGGNNWAMQQMQAQMQIRMQMQQSWMAQQQIAQQKWMQKQQVIGQLSQQLMQIQYQIQMVMAGGTTSIQPGGLTSLPTTGTLPTVTPGAPTHTPVTTPGSTTPGGEGPIQWR